MNSIDLQNSQKEWDINKNYPLSVLDFPEIEKDTKEKVGIIVEWDFSTIHKPEPRKATLRDVRYWFFSLDGKEFLRSILLLPSGKRHSNYRSFIQWWNNQHKKEFFLPETPDELYEIVTGKPWIGLRRKFGEIYDILSGKTLNDWYMSPNELHEWYKTPDENGKTGRDYIFEGIRCSFYSSWYVIAKNINKRRRIQNLWLIQETPLGLIRCMSEKGDVISHMLIAFGEDPDQVDVLIAEAKNSKGKEATREDIKIWFHEKWGKDFLKNLLEISVENRPFKYKTYRYALNKKGIKGLEELSYDFPEKITDLFRVVIWREWKKWWKNNPLQEVYDFLLTGSESWRCMTSEELKEWYIGKDVEMRNGRGVIIEAIGRGFKSSWKTIAEKENIKRKQRWLPLIHISSSGIMKAMVPTEKMQLLPFLMAFGETESKAIELLKELKKWTGKFASKTPIQKELTSIQKEPTLLKKRKKKKIQESSSVIPGTELFLENVSPVSRIYFALFIRAIESYGIPKKWLTSENIQFLSGEKEGEILVSSKIIKLIQKEVLVDLAEKSSESGHKITSNLSWGCEMYLSIKEMEIT